MTTTWLGQLLLVGMGGFLGTGARYLLSGWVHRWTGVGLFPVGTLAVNVLGCAVIGLLGGLLEFRQMLGPAQRLFLLIGVLGGFTTYSTFAYETLELAQGSEFARAGLNILLHVGLGLAAAWFGFQGARYL